MKLGTNPTISLHSLQRCKSNIIIITNNYAVKVHRAHGLDMTQLSLLAFYYIGDINFLAPK